MRMGVQTASGTSTAGPSIYPAGRCRARPGGQGIAAGPCCRGHAERIDAGAPEDDVLLSLLLPLAHALEPAVLLEAPADYARMGIDATGKNKDAVIGAQAAPHGG